MDCWPNTLSHSTLYFLQDWQVWVSVQLSSDPVKATSGRLAPLNGHGFVIMVCSELGLHRELTNSVLRSIWSDLRAMESPNLASGFQSSSYSILYPYIKTTIHPHPPTLLPSPVILLLTREKLPKTGLILGITNVYTHSVIASK